MGLFATRWLKLGGTLLSVRKLAHTIGVIDAWSALFSAFGARLAQEERGCSLPELTQIAAQELKK
eukprot:1934644-Amphidinium_carterae.2